MFSEWTLRFSNYQRLASYSQANRTMCYFHREKFDSRSLGKIEKRNVGICCSIVSSRMGVNNDVWMQDAHCNKPYVYTSPLPLLVFVLHTCGLSCWMFPLEDVSISSSS